MYKKQERRSDHITRNLVQRLLDSNARIESKVDKVELKVDTLADGVNGKEDKPGIKGRLIKVEFSVSVMKWVGVAVGTPLIAALVVAVFEIIKRG